MKLSNLDYKLCLAIVSVQIIAFVVYYTGLSGPLLYDDHPQLGPLLDSGQTDFLLMLDQFLQSNSGPFGRPLSMITFIGNAYLSHSDIWWWKLTNLIIHLINSFLIYIFAAQIFRNIFRSTTNRHKWMAFCVMAIWTLHPLNVSTVLYTVQRMTQLSALFTLLGMITYLHGRMGLSQDRRNTWLWIAISLVVCLPAAILSKESGILLILYLILIEWLIFNGEGFSSLASGIKKLPVSVKYSVVVISVITFSVMMYLGFNAYVIDGYAGKEFTLYQRLLTQCRVLVIYIVQIIFPYQGFMGFYHDDLKLSNGFFDPVTTVFSGVFLSGLIFFAWRIRNKYIILTFGIIFYFIGHLLESSFISLEMMFEHRNYLPMLGLLFAFVYMADKLLIQVNHRYTAGPLILLLALTTFFRADVWSNQASLFNYQYKIHPDSEALTIIFANNFANHQDYASARNMVNKLSGIGPKIHLMYLECLEKSRIDNASLQDAITLDTTFTNIYTLTGLTKIAKAGLAGDCQFSKTQFITLLTKILKTRFKGASYKNMLIIYKAHYLRESNLPDAIELLEMAHRLDMSNPVPLFLATHWLLDVGANEKAATMYKRGRQVAEINDGRYQDMISELEIRFKENNIKFH